MALPCHSGGRNGSGGASLSTNQHTNSSGVLGRKSRRKRSTFRVREWMDNEAGQHFRANLVEAEAERRHDAVVAAASADRPKQIGVLAFAGPQGARPRP